jgi:hypothetical protein
MNLYTFAKQKKLDRIITLLGIQMATIKEIADAVKANTDLVNSIAQVTDALIAEVKTLVDASGAVVPGLDALLTDISAQSATLTAAISAGTAAEGLVPPVA